jgi:uncharacterized membrane protein YphA (DoxX/SURF4 family)
MSDVRRTFNDLATLAARMGVGGIFFANGWHKLEEGLTATGQQFATLEAPAPGVWAAATMLIELIGGALLVAGLAVPLCGLVLFAEALAVFLIASGQQGLPLTGGDINLIVALGAASIMLAVSGGGRLSVDHMVVIKRRDAEADDDFDDDFAADSDADRVLASLREPTEEKKPASRRKTGDGSAEDTRTESSMEGGDDTVEVKRGRARPASAAKGATSVDAPVSEPGDTLVAGRKEPGRKPSARTQRDKNT